MGRTGGDGADFQLHLNLLHLPERKKGVPCYGDSLPMIYLNPSPPPVRAPGYAP
jgi:hypothetical protein